MKCELIYLYYSFDMTNEIVEDPSVTPYYLTPPTSSSTQGATQAKKKEKVVLNFAEVAVQHKLAGQDHSSTDDERDRAPSNISGMNHDSDSARHASGNSMN